MTVLCRWSQQLGGRRDGVCDAPAMSEEDRDALGLRGDWCPEHGKRLAALALGLKLKAKKPGAQPIVKAPPITVKSYHQQRTEEALQRASALADDVVAFIKAADSHPVRRREVAAHLNINNNQLSRAINLAAERGEIVALRRSGPNLSGYYTPETLPTDHTNLKAVA